MQLSDLNQLSSVLTVKHPSSLDGQLENQVQKVTSDSRQVGPGTIFVALVGSHTDGHQYIQSAVDAGALAVVIQADQEKNVSLPQNIGVYVADNTYQALGALCDLFYDQPAKKMSLVGVTGTNGKTTVTHLIEHMLAYWGKSVGLIGTLGKRQAAQSSSAPKKGTFETTGHTTPMAPELHAMLADMVNEKTEYLVMEVSSHALEQHRVYGCDFKVAVHTNVTQDHLDYHHTMTRYAEAKSMLFSGLSAGATAVINQDDDWASTMKGACSAEVNILTYGLNLNREKNSEQAMYCATDVTYEIHQTSFMLNTPEGAFPLTVQLAGQFGVYNALAAIASGVGLGIPLPICLEAIQTVSGIRGRFEVVAQKPSVIVDYAHTPDGLENVLSAAKRITPKTGRLVAVFGCGGDRDATKRPQMGRIAEQYADVLVVTSDNPRTENPQQILSDVVRGIQQFDATCMSVIEDRRDAIRHAIDLAQPEDVIVVAGKGHEDYQILADRTIHFDDREEVQTYLKERTVPA